MSLPIKLTIGALTLGSAGGLTYASIGYFQQGTKINELIEKEYEYILLKTEDKEWAENWKNYKTDENNVLNLDDWKNLKLSEDSTELKKKCAILSTTKINNTQSPIYSNVTSYCARSVTVEDEAKKNNLTILKTIATETGSIGDGPIWKKRHDIAKTTLKDTLSKLDVKQEEPTEQDIKNGCNNVKAKNKKDQKYKEIYDAYVKVCTKQPGETVA